MKTYVLTLSQTFPVYHPRKGEPTCFEQKVFRSTYKEFCGVDVYKDDWLKAQERPKFEPAKLHTIRGNYELWRKRFDEIEAGQACLSIRKWTGKPYASKQEELTKLTYKDGIGMQLLCFAGNFSKKDRELHRPIVGGTTEVDYKELATNDGLSLQDWEDWFKHGDYDLSEPMCIIHFTSFRYECNH